MPAMTIAPTIIVDPAPIAAAIREAPAPVVNVEVAAPVVTVEAPHVAATVDMSALAERKVRRVPTRDETGRILYVDEFMAERTGS